MLLTPMLVAMQSITSAAPQKAVSLTEINALAAKVRTYKPKDEFDAAPSQPTWAGRPFVLTLSPKPSRMACFGSPTWSYSAETQTLYVSPGGSDLGLAGFRGKQGVISKVAGEEWGRPVRYFATACERINLPSYTATNAYGATFNIDPTAQIITAIADDPIKPAWPEAFKLQISGDAARSLVEHLGIRLSGTLRDWKPGVAMACDIRRDGPTATSPYDRTRNLCIANGRIDRFAVIDKRTGHILHAQDRP
jgi:hypothetical protein